MINPFKELHIDYDGIEYDGLDEKIKKKYENTIKFYDKLINSIYKLYPNLPRNLDDLDNIDLMKTVKENTSSTEFENQYLQTLESECITLEKYVTLLKDAYTKKEALSKNFVVIETTGSRLLYSCEMHKRTTDYSETSIKSTEYQSDPVLPINIGNKKLQKIGTLKYINWTAILESYIDKYMLTDDNGNVNYVFANIPKDNLDDPKFVSFLSKTMFNQDYINYATTYNGGYLGEPEKTSDGNYKLVFANEDMAAVKKFEKLKQKTEKEDFTK